VRLLVLGAGPPQLGVLAAARRRDLTVVAADRDPSAPGFRYADRRAIVSIEDEPAIDRLARAEEIDGVIAPGTDHAVAIAARIAERLGLSHPLRPGTAVLAVSKPRQREQLAAAGIPQPRSLAYPSAVEAAEAAAELGEDAVVVADEERWLVEERSDHRLLTVNAFVVDGRFVPLTVTDREQAPPPAFGVALAHLWPSDAPAREVEAAVGTAAAAARALGIEHGPTITQLLLAPDGPLVAKVSARIGGGHEAELARLAVGVDESAAAIRVALGEPVGDGELAAHPRVGGAAVRFLVAPAGVLRDVTGVDDARAVDGVRAVRVYREPSHVFGPLRRASDRAGVVLATGATRAEADAAAAAAAGRIGLVTAPVEAVA
jgi:formate-dependent phosphoribosylglycinamide formyltransferase (GAR transformylase)